MKTWRYLAGLSFFATLVHEGTIGALRQRKAIGPAGAVIALGAIAGGTDLAVGTGKVALVVEGEVEGAEAVALAPGANHSGHELSATAGHALDLSEELGVARSLVIDELGRQGPQVLLLLFEQWRDAAAVGCSAGSGSDFMDEVVGGGNADVVRQVVGLMEVIADEVAHHPVESNLLDG